MQLMDSAKTNSGRNFVMASLSFDDCCFSMAGIKIFASEPGYTHTGMRPNSESFRLEWSQVQLEASEFMANGYMRVKESKTQRLREFCL